MVTDAATLQFRMLNRSKGPAMWSPRAQCDKLAFSLKWREVLLSCSHLSVYADFVENLLFENGVLAGVRTITGAIFKSQAVILTAGTFLNGKMFIGPHSFEGGRIGELSAYHVSDQLAALGIPTARMKTGTPPRIDVGSVDLTKLPVQVGDPEPARFSFLDIPSAIQGGAPQMDCYILHTNEAVHDILRSGFDRSPLFTGLIHGRGPRYCPSIEDKINRFGDRDGHQLFLEPEQADIGRVYINGFSSSLPADIQLAAIHTIPGLTRARVLQIGYAVEYDSVDATQLYPTFECKNVPGLYFAGQVCGTSGYEEAAGQGLLAGINAALKIKGEAPFILGRSDSYLGVMADDLSNILLDEPYRMFTSRAEYRLFLRSDNAEMRLKERARDIGMISDADYADWKRRRSLMDEARRRLAEESALPEQANVVLESGGQALASERTRWINVLRRPGIDPELFFRTALPDMPLARRDQWFLYAEEIYAGFFDRQAREIDDQKKMESVRLPEDFDFMQISAISIESRQRLNAHRPLTLGQASRIPGMRPADITVLAHWLEK